MNEEIEIKTKGQTGPVSRGFRSHWCLSHSPLKAVRIVAHLYDRGMQARMRLLQVQADWESLPGPRFIMRDFIHSQMSHMEDGRAQTEKY